MAFLRLKPKIQLSAPTWFQACHFQKPNKATAALSAHGLACLADSGLEKLDMSRFSPRNKRVGTKSEEPFLPKSLKFIFWRGKICKFVFGLPDVPHHESMCSWGFQWCFQWGPVLKSTRVVV